LPSSALAAPTLAELATTSERAASSNFFIRSSQRVKRSVAIV
jgi:hypothetical protein